MAVAVKSTILVPQSPQWWVHRLWIQLEKRNQMLDFFEDYYTGQHPLPWLHSEAEEEFREILHMARSNYCGLVVDAQVERMMVDGFRVGVPTTSRGKDNPNQTGVNVKMDDNGGPIDGDADTWRIWTANNMDSEFDKALLEAAIGGMSYVSLAPNPDDPSTPLMYVEHPTQCIIEHVPGTNRRKTAAALKVYDDDWTGSAFAVLYLLEDGDVNVYKFRQARARTAQPNIRLSDLEKRIKMERLIQPQWTERVLADEEWGAAAEVYEVPVYEIPNNPRMLTGGRSELEDVTDIQDRINKTLADRLITQDYGAFPQKWVSGWPDTDANGNKNPEIQTGRNRIVATEVVETKFGQWDAASLDPYSAAKREDVKDIASRTRTPSQYLLGEMSNVNGQTLKASESGLVAKVRQRMRNIDDPLERFVRHARALAGLQTDPRLTVETIWRNPEHRTEGELVDALTKMATLGVPEEALWERWGASPPERARWKQMQDDAVARSMSMDPLTGMLAHRYRTLAGPNPKAAAAQAEAAAANRDRNGDGVPDGRQKMKNNPLNNSGAGTPGVPGASGKAGRPGINGRPRGSSKPAGASA